MIYDVQKAGIGKRISAYIFDLILLVIAATGVAFLLSVLFQYDAKVEAHASLQEQYEAEYGVSFDLSAEEFDALDEAGKTYLNEAYKAFKTDPDVARLDSLLLNLVLLISSLGILIPYLLLEFLVPLKLGNGQTLGKKIFGIAVMRVDGVRLPPMLLFIRTVLGKYTLETMLPLFLCFVMTMGVMPVACVLGLAILAVTQLFFIIAKPLRTPIHEMISATVSVDFASQMIFETPEELMEYKKQLHAQEAERAEYK